MVEINKAQQVRKIFLDCLYQVDELPAPKDGRPPSDAIIVEGITGTFGFHPKRLELHREEVRALLDQMPDPFHKSKGGGWSFLNLCMDKDGSQWAEHPTMQELVVLAIGLKMGSYCMPREMWRMFPGSVPYVCFDTRAPASDDPEEEYCWCCGGTGFADHDCGEDTCCCKSPENNVKCNLCRGTGVI